MQTNALRNQTIADYTHVTFTSLSAQVYTVERILHLLIY